jgi:hypothetical protein
MISAVSLVYFVEIHECMDLIHPPLFPLFPSPPTSTHRLTGSVSQSCPSFYRLCSLFTVTTLYMSLLVAIPALWSESGHTRHHHQCDHSGTGVWLVVERVLIIARHHQTGCEAFVPQCFAVAPSQQAFVGRTTMPFAGSGRGQVTCPTSCSCGRLDRHVRF